MTTPLFPSVIAWNVLDGGTNAQDGNNYPGPALQDYAAAVVGAAADTAGLFAIAVPVPDSVRAMTAAVRNPLSSACTNEPIEIRVAFDQGVCASPANIIVYDPSGNITPHQWEPAKHPLTNTPQALWPDGTVRAGSVWVLGSIGASATVAYSVRVGATQTAGAQNVTYGSESATIEYFQTTYLRTRFPQDRAWIPKSFKDPSRSLAEFNSASNGLYCRYTHEGVNKFSYTAADVTSVSRQLIDSDAFGYGVVYQEFEASFAWAVETTTTVKARFRQWANNRVTWSVRYDVSVVTGSGDNGLSVYGAFSDSTTPTATYSLDNGYYSLAYADTRRLLIGMSGFQSESAAYQITGETNLYSCASNELRIGFAKNPHTLPAGSYYSWSGYFSVEYDAVADEALRCNNPIIVRATSNDVETLKAGMRAGLATMAYAWIPVEAADTTDYAYAGSQALARIALAKYRKQRPPLAEALALFQKWCTIKSIDPTDSATYHTAWDSADVGFEFIGPNTGVISKLRAEYIAAGDTVNTALMTTYLHELADFIVAAEVTSGGSGKMKIRGTGADNFNAEATAMGMLCDSLAIAADATRQATLDRIVARFVQSYQLGNKTAYTFQSGGSLRAVVQFMRAAYHFYNVYAAIRADHTYPCLSSEIDYRQFALQYVTPLVIADEARWNKQYTRRGLPSNLSSAAYAVCMGGTPDAGDWQHAYDLIRHLTEKIPGPTVVDKTIDGWLAAFDGTISAAWGGSDAPSSAWHLLYELSVE